MTTRAFEATGANLDQRLVDLKDDWFVIAVIPTGWYYSYNGQDQLSGKYVTDYQIIAREREDRGQANPKGTS